MIVNDLNTLLECAIRKGSERAYLDWLSLQPSCISKVHSEFHDSGIHRSIPAHVRRVKYGSGIGKKPPYMAVPLTDAEHKVQHSGRGERGCLLDAGWDVSEEEAKSWFEERAIRYLRLWIES